jgi:hypothetical protein
MTKPSDNTGESTNANKIIIRGEGRRLQLFDSPMLGDLSVQGEQLSTLYKFRFHSLLNLYSRLLPLGPDENDRSYFKVV